MPHTAQTAKGPQRYRIAWGREEPGFSWEFTDLAEAKRTLEFFKAFLAAREIVDTAEIEILGKIGWVRMV